MVEYKNGTECIDWLQLTQLYGKVGLVAGYGKDRNTKKIRQAFEASGRVATAWIEGRLVGAGRMITDNVCYAYIADVAVLPSLQKKGIGKGIMIQLLKDTAHMSIQLWPTKGNIAFYERLGFSTLGSEHPMMIIRRSQQSAGADGENAAAAQP